MSLADGRDIAIIVVGVLAIVEIILLIALTAVVLAKIGPILNSVRSTVNNVRGTSAFVSDVAARPVVRAISFASGVRRAIQVILRFTNGRKGG